MKLLSNVRKYKTLVTFGTFLWIFFNCGIVLAQECGDLMSGDYPEFACLMIPVVRVLNLLVLSGGAVVVGMIAYASVKFALAQGDPKAMQGARQTLTYVFLGAFAVLGVYVIQTLITGSLGITNFGVGDPQSLFTRIQSELNALMGITTSTPTEPIPVAPPPGEPAIPL